VFLVGLVLVNFPVLAVVDHLRLPGGIPATPLYLFLAWLGMIALTWRMITRPPGED
jgi:hypothetical protein